MAADLGRAALGGERPTDTRFLQEMQAELLESAARHGSDATLDLAFLVFLRKLSRFGYFSYGPITIDVHVIEEVVARAAPAGLTVSSSAPVFADDYVRFTRFLMEEVRRSGRRVVGEREYLLALMRCGMGLPARVFGELGVTADQVDRYHPATANEGVPLERLFSPEEVAEYLGVHVQTVRAWVRSGRLPARRLAGQRVLRIRAVDVEGLLEPLEPGGA